MDNVTQVSNDVNRQRRQERERRMTAVVQGHVETPSAWDGWSLDAYFAELLRRGVGRRAAAEFTDQLMINRFHWLDEGLGRIVDSLDLSIASIPVYEFEPEPSFWQGDER